jgi:hypothetical protein
LTLSIQSLVKTVTPSPEQLLSFVFVGLINLATVELAKWVIFIRPESRGSLAPVY